jgi:hypothetical protein
VEGQSVGNGNEGGREFGKDIKERKGISINEEGEV